MDSDISKKRKTKWEASSGDESGEDHSITKRLKKEKKERKKKKKKLKEYDDDAIDGEVDDTRNRSETVELEAELEARSRKELRDETFHEQGIDTDDSDEGEDSLANIRTPAILEGPFITPCRHVDNYEKLNRIAEGAYGVVYRARDRSTGEIVALKKLKLNKEKNGFPITSLREIYALLLTKHRHIVNVKEIVCGDNPNK